MKTTHPLIFISILCFGAAAFAQENVEDLKQRLLAQAQSVTENDYAFTRTVRNDVTALGNAEQTVNVEKYDPTKPARTRWTLVSVNGAPPSAGVLRKFRRKAPKRHVPGYHHLANYVALPATATKDARGQTVLRYSNLPKGSVVVMNSDVSRIATVDIVVSEAGGTPFAEQVRLSLKPTRMMFMIKLNSLESTSRYRLGADGRPLLVEETSDMSGSGLGLEGQLRALATYGDYRAVRDQR